ncbi:MAG: transketolase [Planctomycetota bacterium]|jgi:transketolase
MPFPRGFETPELPDSEVERLAELGRQARGDIIHMTTLASSGHPGGSMSSIDINLVVYSYARIDPGNPLDPTRDLIVVSHGHTSPAVYSALGRVGFFSTEDAIVGFRRPGTPFEGHVEHCVPGVEWNTGNLGQGLSASVGFALAQRLHKRGGHSFCLMSDGEQAKGQVAEARRFAQKFGLNNVTVVIDYNRLQISGDLHEVMPQDIPAMYAADGWKVVEVNGHDVRELYTALHRAVQDKDERHAIVAHTTMGKGVTFMEGEYKYHGAPLKAEEARKAFDALGVPDRLEEYGERRETLKAGQDFHCPIDTQFHLDPGSPQTYEVDAKTDNRSAFGRALLEIALANRDKEGASPMAVLDCDLAASVKTGALGKEVPEFFYQSGVQEHATASIAGALSARGIVTFFADFGVFGVDETYNQHRLNDINWTNLKLACTHLGLDVGEDGKTHQCIDYLGLLRNLFGFNVVVPADPNQTDRVVRAVAPMAGNWFLGMGRSKTPVIVDGEGHPFFGGDYAFEYGRIDRVRTGKDATILAYGSTLARALTVRTLLAGESIDAAVWNVSCPKDPDRNAILEAATAGPLLVYEDHHAATGLGSVVAGLLAGARVNCAFGVVGVTRYGCSGKVDAVFKDACASPEDAAKALKALCAAP